MIMGKKTPTSALSADRKRCSRERKMDADSCSAAGIELALFLSSERQRYCRMAVVVVVWSRACRGRRAKRACVQRGQQPATHRPTACSTRPHQPHTHTNDTHTHNTHSAQREAMGTKGTNSNAPA
jgi:hypothetical protein